MECHEMQYQMPVRIIDDNDGYRTTENIQTPIVGYQVAVAALSTSTKAIQQRTKAEVDNAVKLWDNSEHDEVAIEC
eukprot:scaffold1188_cov78-Skeletonema_dohrnii-CCMP3373.AAC.2